MLLLMFQALLDGIGAGENLSLFDLFLILSVLTAWAYAFLVGHEKETAA